MEAIKKDVIIVGGGPAGLAAANQLYKTGVTDILILERENQLGGILKQCIHDGFGLERFGESLSGPEYAQRFIDEANALGVPYALNTSVVDITPDRIVTALSRNGMTHYEAKAVVLTMGCRERTRGALLIPGSRPAGIYNAGVAQSYINLHNTMVGKEIIILGSGDIGMIMARRMTLEGAHVKGVYEVLPYPSGLPRNIQQCLNDYDIPLYLSRTVTAIHGQQRIEGVTISQTDENLKPIPGTEEYVSCDTLVLSVGLIPENELSLKAGVDLDMRTKGAFVDDSLQTGCPGIFAAGNVLHVHDLVDFVSVEAENLAKSVAEYLKQGKLQAAGIPVAFDAAIGHVIPQSITGQKDFVLSLRTKKPFGKCTVVVKQGESIIAQKKMPKAIPAEMIQMQISANNIVGNNGIEVSIVC